MEAFYGWKVDSLALLADAGHNLGDVGGLFIAWGGWAASRIVSDDRHTYGWRRASILASFVNALLLLVAMGALAWEAVQRFQSPATAAGGTMMAVAAVGVVINGLSAVLFMAGGKADLNLRGAFQHMAADALVSVGVVLAGALSLWQGWTWIDPAMSLVIALVIVAGTWSLFRQSLHLLFDGVPENIDLKSVRECLMGLRGVGEIHDLHVWAMGTSEVALTAHLVLKPDQPDTDALLQKAADQLHDRFEIRHVTLQLESDCFAAKCKGDPGKIC